MKDTITNETVAYVSPSETTWCVALRDGRGLADGFYTIPRRNYYETVEQAHEAAQRAVDDERADRYTMSMAAQRELEGDND